MYYVGLDMRSWGTDVRLSGPIAGQNDAMIAAENYTTLSQTLLWTQTERCNAAQDVTVKAE